MELFKVRVTGSMQVLGFSITAFHSRQIIHDDGDIEVREYICLNEFAHRPLLMSNYVLATDTREARIDRPFSAACRELQSVRQALAESRCPFACLQTMYLAHVLLHLPVGS